MDVIVNETILCSFEKPMNDATHAYYTHLRYKIDDSWTASYYSPDFDITLEENHAHATILVKVFGDKFDFSQPQFHLKDPKINLEPAQPTLFTETLMMQTLDCSLRHLECR